ncbi:MAG: tetratricopeptide repeat protein [Candidatus Hodarchaeota archaeon]
MKYPKITTLMNRGKFDEAIQLIESLPSEDCIKGLIFKSRILVMKGEFNEAFEVAQRALSQIKSSLQRLKVFIIQGYIFAHLRKPIQLTSKIGEIEELISQLDANSEIQESLGALAFLKGWMYFFNGDGEKSVESMRESLEIHEDLDNPLNVIDSLLFLAAFHHVFSIGDFKLRNDYAQRSLALSHKLKNPIFIAWAHIAIGYAHWAVNTDVTLSYFEKAMTLNQELENKYMSGILFSDIGIIHTSRENYDLALEYLEKSAEIFKQLGSPSYSINLSLIGDIHHAKGDVEKALGLYQKTLEEFESSGNIIRLIGILMGIGQIHFLRGDLELATESFKQSLSKARETNYRSSIAYSLEWLAYIHIHQGELDKALIKKNQSLKLFKDLEDHQGIAFSYRRFGDLFRLRGDYSRAIQYYEDGIRLLNETIKGDEKKHVGIVSSVLVQLSLIAEDLDEPDKAKEYLQKMRKLRQSSEYSYVKLRTRFVEALVLKMSKRGTKKLQAIEEFQNIVDEPVLDFEITLYATIFLCELLILELKISDSAEELFLEIIDLSNRFYDKAHAQKSPFFVVIALILKSKIYLVRGEIEEANSFLTRAEEIADQKKFLSLSKNIKTEQEVIRSELDKWHELTRRNAPLKDRIEQAQVLNYLQEAKKLQEAWTSPKLDFS